MKLTYIALLLSILTFGSLITTTFFVNDFYNKISYENCNQYFLNQHYIWLPKTVSDIFHNDKINLYFRLSNGKISIINGIVKDHGIYSLNCGSNNADFDVYMSDLNALELATSTKPITTFVRLWENDEITIRATNSSKLQYSEQLLQNDHEPVPEDIRNFFNKYKKLG